MGFGRKFSRGGGNGKNTKINKKCRKIALFSLSRGRGQWKKRPKNSKKGRKIALFSLSRGRGQWKKKTEK